MFEKNAESLIVVSRDQHGWRDRARSYKIVVDGQPAAKIRRGQRVELPLASGQHEIFIRVNWGSSEAIDLELKPGESVELFCATGRSQIGEGYINLTRA